MTFSLPNATFNAARPTRRNGTPVRVVPAPAPKTFALEVAWEETDVEPTALPVRINSVAGEPLHFVTKILRLTVPLELRLDPAL